MLPPLACETQRTTRNSFSPKDCCDSRLLRAAAAPQEDWPHIFAANNRTSASETMHRTTAGDALRQQPRINKRTRGLDLL